MAQATCMTAVRVLLIDDDESMRSGVATWLQEDGHDVVVAGTGSDGLARARDGVDVVVLDYDLPDLDGLEVLRLLRGEHPRLPVIMLTGHASSSHAGDAMRRGAFHYLAKPADLEEVSRAVARAATATLQA
jgi:two-component system response regulator AtoC